MRIFRADDADARFVIPITARTGDLSWSSPKVKVDDTDIEVTATWLGSPGPTREIQVPLGTLPADVMLFLRLVVPGDTDVELGWLVRRT